VNQVQQVQQVQQVLQVIVDLQVLHQLQVQQAHQVHQVFQLMDSVQNTLHLQQQQTQVQVNLDLTHIDKSGWNNVGNGDATFMAIELIGDKGSSGTSGLSGTSGTGFKTIYNNVDNRILTGRGTSGTNGQTANAEANLTFDGDVLGLDAANLRSNAVTLIGSTTTTILDSTNSINISLNVTFEYLITDIGGNDMRAGTFMAITDGSSVNITETMTTDIGDTSDVEITASVNSGKLRISGVNSNGANYYMIYISRELYF
jgi:hypothetical protein